MWKCVVVSVFVSQICVSASATLACAHRGDNKNAPENTIPAFILAVEKKAPQIEFDVYLTKDGRLVVIHDKTVDRTTNGKGPVADMTFEEIRALDAGSWFDPKFKGTKIPTLREVLDVIPRDILCNIHLKGETALANAVVKDLVDAGRLDSCFLACSNEQAAAAKVPAPNVRVCNMSRQGNDRDAYVDVTIASGAEFIQLLGGTEGLKDAVAKLHAHNVKVNYFEAHTEDKIRECVDAGVDYILTDDLELCMRIVGAKAGSAGK